MCEKVGLFVEGEAEIRAPGQRVDGIFRAREEVPARSRFRTPEMGHRRFFFLKGHIGSLARIKAYENDLVIAARIEGKHAQRPNHALLHLIAEHGTAVVHERKDDRLLSEIFAELNTPAGLVAKGEVELQLRVEPGLETDILQREGQGTRSRSGIVRDCLRANYGRKQQRGDSGDGAKPVHMLTFSFPPAGPSQPAILSRR